MARIPIAYGYHHLQQAHGLVYLLPETLEPKCAPLVHVTVEVKLIDQIAHVSLAQEYTNDFMLPIQATYVFPIPARAAVCAFSFIRGDSTKVIGAVKEKKEARAEYEEAVKAGQTAALGEEQTKDVFQISVGNIDVTETITVNLSYVVELLDDESIDQVKFILPAKIGSRYGAPPNGVNVQPTPGFPCSITVEVQQPGPIKSISCPSSHPIEFELGKSERSKGCDQLLPESHFASVRLISNTFLDKDFVLSIRAATLDAPRCVIEPHPSPNHSTVAMGLTLVPRFKVPDVKGGSEYIFLVDRSGSMAGVRLEAAQKALVVLIRGLPSKDTTFNIVSFGSKFDALWKAGSRSYNADTMAEATKHVDSMDANFGGTEIARALHYAFERRSSKQNRPTNVFMLTDGDSHDLTNVLKVVQDAVEGSAAKGSVLRVFCLGIGSGISTQMCEGVARAGKGFSLAVSDGEEMTGKCAKLVRAARTPSIEDIEVEWTPTGLVSSSEADDFEMVGADDGDQGDAAAEDVEPPKKKIKLFGDASNGGGEDVQLSTGPPPAVVVSIQQLPADLLQQAPYKIPALYPGVRFQVYAILSEKILPKLEDMPRSIKLKGRICGTTEVVELEVATHLCALGSKTADEEVLATPVHTLAARGLVTCLEDSKHNFGAAIASHADLLEAHIKAKITQLGTTYNITSKHTSFVAVDRNSQPLPEGAGSSATVEDWYVPRNGAAIQTARRSTGGKAPRRQVAASSQGRGGRGLGIGGAKRHRKILREGRSEIVTRSASARMATLKSNTEESYMKLIDSAAQVDESEDEDEQEVEDEAEPTPTTDQGRLDALARCQEYNGSFDLTRPFLQLLGLVDCKEARKSLTVKGLSREERANDKLIATLLGIRYMHSTLTALSIAWEALFEKAKEYVGDILGLESERFAGLLQSLIGGS